MSYRRSRLPEVQLLVPLLNEHGIPTWQDQSNIASEPTVEAIARTLEDPQTAGAILWLSKDVEASPVILQEEAPRILKRARANDGFTAKLCLADGLAYADATKVLKMPGSYEDPSRSWNLRPVAGNPATPAALRGVAQAAQRRRLGVLHRSLPSGQPLRIGVFAHALAKPAFQTGFALRLDWTGHFARHASAESWTGHILPVIAHTVEAVRTVAPGRPVLAEGHMSIPAAIALGRGFMEPSGLAISWKQVGDSDHWSLATAPVDSGFVSQLASHDAAGVEMAVLVSARSDVEPAMVASKGTLPKFRAILRVAPATARASSMLNAAQATHLARLVADNMRQARQQFSVVRKIHIFYSGPAGVAMMIGQQLNALGPVQTYEFVQTPHDGVGTYAPAVLLADPH